MSQQHRPAARRRRPAPRHGRLRALLTASAALLLALAGGLAQAQVTLPSPSPATLLGNGFSEPEFLPVEEAYRLAVEADGEQALRLVWQMPPCYYLYQHAFRFELARDGQSLAASAEYPPALTREDEYFGRVQVYYDSADITLKAEGPVRGAQLTVTSQGCADAGLCYPPRTQRFAIAADGSAAELAAPARRVAPPVATASGSAGIAALPLMLLLAFGGGIILNLMPCVLPVLSLKVLGFATAAPRERHRHGLLYSAGVILSFLAVAGLLIGLRGAGQAIGWGFQLQSPTFVLALAYLFVLLGLAMSGAIELGSRFMNLGSGLAGSSGARGSFFTGVLAVVVASPCTAPFMGTALGYALVQPVLPALTVFAALGAGMAAPMLLLSYSELARRRMPRPGPWMERLKQALAFPLYATALWLFWVAGRQGGVDLMAAALLGALFMALGLWLWRPTLAGRGGALACLAIALLLASWRPASDADAGAALRAGSEAYSPLRLAELRSSGRRVFVDVTADWCITCLANERAVLATDAVQQAFRDAGIVYMVADWTDQDPEIAAFVASHGRSGIPLYVLYDGAKAPRVLPQLLRRVTVLEAIGSVAPGPLASAIN